MSLYWALWLVIGFGAPEAWALLTKHPQNTLSDTVWRWCDVVPGRTLWQWSIAHFLLLAFLIWLVGHLAFGIWRAWR